MDSPIIVSAWGEALIAGAIIAVGITQTATGRPLFNPRRINWSSGESRIYGLSIAVVGLYMGTGILTWSGLMPQAFVQSVWWLLWPPLMILTMPSTQIVLERHRNRQWPFKPSASPL